MTASLLTVDGMVHHREDLAVEHLIDHGFLDVDGRLLVAMVDVLAMARLDVDAELVIVQYDGGASCVVRVAEVLGADQMFLQLQLHRRLGADDATWCIRLWSLGSGLSPNVTSMHAMSFASFVGQR